MKIGRFIFCWREILPFFLFLLLISGVFFGLLKTFYQQDEWVMLGQIFSRGAGILFDAGAGQNILKVFFAEGRIFSILMYLLFYAVPFSVVPIFVFSIVFHTLNAFLIFVLTKKITRSYLVSILASLFFALSSVSHQAVTWAAAVGTVPATTLFLVSLLLYLDFLDSGNIRIRNISFIVGILSLFFKETGLFIFVFYPLLYVFWKKTYKVKKIITVHAQFLLYGTALVVFRILEIILAPKAARFVDSGEGFLFPYIYHSVAYPLTSFFQVFVPPADLYAFVSTVVRSEYTYLAASPLFNLVGQSAVADAVSLIGTIILICALGGMFFWDKKKEWVKKIIILGVSIFVLSFFPYVILHKSFSYLDSRYYYVGVIGAALLFGYMSFWLFVRLPKAGRILLISGIVLYLFHHVRVIQKDINYQIVLADERKTYLAQLQRVHPNLENQTVFYLTSDKKYYGEITQPFQNGLGYTLEVLYYHTGKIPKVFLQDIFLWDLGSEGYREAGQYGFGYFEHLDAIGDLVKAGKITPSIVYSYRYDSQAHIMTDITLEVRQKLATLSAQLQ